MSTPLLPNDREEAAVAAGLSERLLDHQETPVALGAVGAAGTGVVPPPHHHHQQQQQRQAVPEADGVVVLDEENNVSISVAEGGVKQPDRFRDLWAALLFVGHLVAVMYLAFAWGVPSLTTTTKTPSSYETTVHYSGLLYLSLTSCVAALCWGAAMLALMMRFAERLVQMSLFFTVACNALLLVFFIFQRYWAGCVVAGLFLLTSALYAYAVWRRIPFAASNLKTALTAVRTNGGVTVVAFGLTAAVYLYSMIWLLAWLGVYVRSSSCESGTCVSHVNAGVVCLFLLSYYWTCQVGKNLLHVTVAGVVGTWWFAPEDANHFCGPAIYDSLFRASTYSLGSVCLGSLLTAILQTLHVLLDQARRRTQHSRSAGILLCVLECIVGCLERLIAYFNKWAYVYVGLYGYDYLEAGKKVMTLFASRGWTVIIQDHLIMRALQLVTLVIALLTAAVGYFVATKLAPSWLSGFDTDYSTSGSSTVAFLVPLFVGGAMTSVLMGVVASAVDTIIVTFAEAPLEFERNHPGLYQQMNIAWRAAYPDQFAG